MTLGARPIGTRTIGDGTGRSLGPAPVNGSATLAGSATISATPSVSATGSALLAGTATIFPNGIVLVNGRAVLSGRAQLIASAPFVQSWDPTKQSAQYRLRIVDLSGDGYTEFENAVIGDVVWELNGIGSCTFTVPVLDDKSVHIKVPEREVQVWRGNQLLWWGVMVRATANNATIEVQCVGLKWYLTRRFFGKVDRTNHLQNPSFENGAAHWDINYLTYSEPVANVTHTNFLWEIRGDKVVTGSRSLYLKQTGTIKYGFKVSQGFEFTVDDEIDPEGTEWTFAVWIYIVGSEWVAANEAGRGMSITRYSTVEFDTVIPDGGGTPQQFPKVIEAVNVTIDENTPQDTWVRLEATLRQPFRAGEAEMITCRIVVPNGAIYVDEATFTAAERTAFYDKDQALIINGIIDHAQDPAYFKSSLNFAKNIPLTGIIRTREYWHSEHQVISDALDEFHTLHEGVDTDIVISPTTRTYTSYFPRKGIERADLVLELGRNIETFTTAHDGTETANSLVVLGDGSGSDREEGGAIDADALTDGLILERVFNAIPGSHIKTLDDQAARGLQRMKYPVVIPSVTTYEGSTRLIGVLQTGDVVPVRISHGYVQVNDRYRIVSISLDPRTERITYAINPAETSFV